MLSLSESDARSSLVVQLVAVESLSVLIDVSTHWVSLCFICQVQILHILTIFVILIKCIHHFLRLRCFCAICSIINTFFIHTWIICVKILSISKDILLATYSISNIFWVIVSKRPVSVTLLDPLEFIDAILNVSKRYVWAFFALLRKIHVFVILVVFVNYSLEEVSFGCHAHALDGLGLRAISFGKGTTTNNSTRKVSHIISLRDWISKL